MVIVTRAIAIGILVSCLALVTSEALGVRVPGRGRVRLPVPLRGRGRVGPRIPETVFNVLKFGARPGGQEDSTEGFMQAWVAACQNFNGRARVLVPPGVYKLSETIFAGPCKSQAPITFQLIGTVIADSDLSNYPDKGWITFTAVNGLVLTGGGTIDGRGQNVWQFNDCKGNSGCSHLPSSLYLNNLKNANIKLINLANSMGFHMHLTNSFNIRLHGLRVTAPANSPNTDGLHISRSQIVKVSRSVFSTGDDCISVGQGASNITVNKVTCGPGHGISVGSLGKYPNELDVRGLIVNNCTLLGTTNGIRIKTWGGSGPSRASGLLFNNIVMNNVQNPIIIDQAYGDHSKPSRVAISNVVYQNIRGTTASPIAVNLMCSSQVPCQNVRFSNINLRSTTNMRLGSTCANGRVSYRGIQFPPPCR